MLDSQVKCAFSVPTWSVWPLDRNWAIVSLISHVCLCACMHHPAARLHVEKVWECFEQKGGLQATGTLSHVCKAAGIASVSLLLESNPQAKRPTSAIDRQAAPKACVCISRSLQERQQKDSQHMMSRLCLHTRLALADSRCTSFAAPHEP